MQQPVHVGHGAQLAHLVQAKPAAASAMLLPAGAAGMGAGKVAGGCLGACWGLLLAPNWRWAAHSCPWRSVVAGALG